MSLFPQLGRDVLLPPIARQPSPTIDPVRAPWRRSVLVAACPLLAAGASGNSASDRRRDRDDGGDYARDIRGDLKDLMHSCSSGIS